MLTRSRRPALTSIQHGPSASFILPFLYMTATICLSGSPSLQKARSDRKWKARVSSPLDRSLKYKPEEPTKVSSGSPPSFLKQLAEISQRRAESNPESVPDNSFSAAERHTTITENEKEVFEKIIKKLKRGASPSTNDDIKREELIGPDFKSNAQKAADLVELLTASIAPEHKMGTSLSDPDEETGSRQLFLQDRRTFEGSPLFDPHQPEPTAAEYFNIKEIVDRAESDKDIWQTLVNHVFPLVEGLKTSEKLRSTDHGKSETAAGLSNVIAAEDPDLEPPRVEAENFNGRKDSQLKLASNIYSPLLLFAARKLLDLNSSNLVLSLYEHFRSLSHISRVLGSSTGLYNIVLDVLSSRSLDLITADKLLTEMENHSIAFDYGTLGVIEKAMRIADEEMRDEKSLGAQRWKSSNAMSAYRKIAEWKQKIRQELTKAAEQASFTETLKQQITAELEAQAEPVKAGEPGGKSWAKLVDKDLGKDEAGYDRWLTDLMDSPSSPSPKLDTTASGDGHLNTASSLATSSPESVQPGADHTVEAHPITFRAYKESDHEQKRPIDYYEHFFERRDSGAYRRRRFSKATRNFPGGSSRFRQLGAGAAGREEVEKGAEGSDELLRDLVAKAQASRASGSGLEDLQQATAKPSKVTVKSSGDGLDALRQAAAVGSQPNVRKVRVRDDGFVSLDVDSLKN